MKTVVSIKHNLIFSDVTTAWTAGLWTEFDDRSNKRYGAWVWNGTGRVLSSEASKLWFPGFYSWQQGKKPEGSFRKKSCATLNRIFKDKDRRKYADVGYFWLENNSCKERLPFICQRPSFGSTSRKMGEC